MNYLRRVDFRPEPPRHLPRRVLSPAVQRILWALALFVFLGAGFFSFFLPVGRKGGPPITVMVERGLSSAGIARKLEQAGLIRSRWAFQLTAIMRGRAGSLKAGTYQFTGGESLRQLIERLASGEVADLVFTIPEGLNSREIADRVSSIIGCTPEAFLEAVNDSAAAAKLGIPTRNFEGYLFPDTYRVLPGTAPGDLVGRLVGRMIELYDQHFATRAESLGFTRHQTITLASLVEAEARVDDERPRIAAVFLNRLRVGMKLQSDPTVAFVLGRRPDRIYEKDLTIDSPYNTYAVTGLPPGPICSPGESSIRAALFPQPDCRDYYFVATGDGHHVFSATNDQHNEARKRVATINRSFRGSR